MRAVRSPEMNSPLANLAKVDEDAPIARRRSVFVMSLSISCFHSFLYDTVTTLPLNERANYTISGENWERHICFFAQKVFITKLCVRFRTSFQDKKFFSRFLRAAAINICMNSCTTKNGTEVPSHFLDVARILVYATGHTPSPWKPERKLIPSFVNHFATSLSIHAMRKSMMPHCRSAGNSTPRGTFLHFARQSRQQQAQAC